MITYSTNWMGPVSMNWYRERGLLDSKGVITLYYSAGRIDIRDSTKPGYDGWHEYGLAPMHGEDWNDFSEWLDDFKSQELLDFDDLIAQYEEDRGRKIRWWEDKTSC